MVKESVLSVVEQRIIEHRLYTEGTRELIARARVDQPRAVQVSSADGETATIELPRQIRLTIPEVAELTMSLGGVQPNPPDDFAAQTSFVRPEKQGYHVVDILDLARQPGVALAEGGRPATRPVSRATEPRSSPSSPSAAAPGRLVLPRSDPSVARVEEEAIETIPGETRFAPARVDAPISSDLPEPAAIPGTEIRRSTTWDTSPSSRFPKALLGGN